MTNFLPRPRCFPSKSSVSPPVLASLHPILQTLDLHLFSVINSYEPRLCSPSRPRIGLRFLRKLVFIPGCSPLFDVVGIFHYHRNLIPGCRRQTTPQRHLHCCQTFSSCDPHTIRSYSRVCGGGGGCGAAGGHCELFAGGGEGFERKEE